MPILCVCGHAFDEHTFNHPCDVDGCLCLGFEEDEDTEMTIKSEHLTDAEGNPAGGVTYGIGFGIVWQNGPLNGPGGHRNGAFVEDLLVAVIDRIGFYQETRFACEENEEALDRLYAAQSALKRRTARRIAEGTEGTHRV